MKKVILSLLVFAGFAANSFAQMPVADFSGNPTTICAGQAVPWTNLSTGTNGGTTYTWAIPGATIPFSTLQTPAPRTYTASGVYDVQLIVDNGGGNADTVLKPNYITVLSASITVTPSPNAYICTSGSATLTASGGVSYTWSPSNGLNVTTGAVVVATRSTTATYTVIGTNSNGCSNKATVTVSVNNTAPSNPGAITGSTNVCSGQTAGYSVAGVTPPAPYRSWTVPPGATIIAGQGTRSITVTFGSTTGDVCCTATNACGSSTPSCITVTVNPTPAVGTTGTITGPQQVCANQTGVTYSVSPVANAANYNWTIPGGGAAITSGQGTNVIVVDMGTNSGQVCVTPSNSCNTGTQVCKNVLVSGSIPVTPGAIAGSTTVCSGQSGVQYFIASVAGATSYTWSTAATASITAGQGTRTVTISYGSASETVCVTANNACGSSATSCQNIFVDPTPALGAIGTITGPAAACANQTGVTYIIPAVANATSYTWTASGGATISGGQGTNTVTIDFLTNNSNICVTASNNCSTSAQTCMAVPVSAGVPSIPGPISGYTTVCTGTTGAIYSVAAVAGTTNYAWTTAATASITAGQGTRTVTISFASASETVCVTAGNACGTSLPNCLTVSVVPSAAVGTISTISGPTAACAGQSGIIYTIPAVANATNYNWTVGTATVTAGQGTNTVTLTFGASSTTICVTASNACSSVSSNCEPILVSGTAPGIPTSITGPAAVCNGSAGVDYIVGFISGATSYNWSTTAGGTITAGQGTRTVTVTFGSANDSVCVTTSNACGTSLPKCKYVTVDSLGAVGTIGAISGPVAACQNQSGVNYSIVPVTNAATYTWSITPATTGTITAGQGTTSIVVTFGTTGGTICVDAGNSCSSAAQSCQAVTVAPSAPAIPGAISGPTTVCSGQTSVSYTIANVTNATNYTWSVPAGSSITAGQGTTAATISFGSTPGVATVSVTAGNACGTSMPKTLNVTIDANPALGSISTIAGSTAICANQTNLTYIIPSVANATNYNWTVPASATVTAGAGTQTITVDFANVSGNICVNANNTCGVSPSSCLSLTVSPSAPTIPVAITGATAVCTGQVGNYSIAPVANGINYTWTVPTGATITSGQGTTDIVVTFGSTAGQICVTAGNGCGTSAPACINVAVGATALTVSTTPTDASTSTACDGMATAAPAGGTGPYTYSWSPIGGVTASVTGLCVGTYTVCVTDAGGCMTCKTVTISSPTGVPAITDNGTIKVFPNPANDFIFVEGTLNGSANLQVNIVNMFGQRVIDKSVNANGNFSDKISISGIPTGVYFIEIRSGEFVRNTKIIKVQ